MSTSRPRLTPWLGLLTAACCLAASAGCLAPSSRGVTVWIVAGDDALTGDTPASLENELFSASRGELRLRAALNETIGFQVALHADAPPAGPFTVTMSDLNGPAGLLPTDSAVSIYRVHYTRVDRFRSWYPEHTGKPAVSTLFPDILVPWDAPRGGGPINLAERRNELVWIDLYVPPTMAPGEYTGRLEVRRRGGSAPTLACQVQLEVLPVALPGRRSLPVICRVDPRDLLTAHLRWPRVSAELTRLLPELSNHASAIGLVGETMRLFHDHGTSPVLWASFPKFTPLGKRGVEVQWDEYDQLVAGWLDGSAFADRARCEFWPIPATLEYPAADQNGGLDSAAYGRLLAAYLQECERHFTERGWADRAFLRLCPPGPLTQAALDRVRQAGVIVRQSETRIPQVAHLPARSLRGLGWVEAPTVDLPDVQIWAPPAMWYESPVMEQQRKAGQQTWFMPDVPPYSGTLAVESLATDARALAWQAYRYGATALWVEHAAEVGSAGQSAGATLAPTSAALVYPAVEYGLRDRPVPSVRLKRLLRGIQDYELLRLLEDNGKRLLARQLAEQVVRWAFTDACQENLLSCKETGWPRRAAVLRLARDLMLQELAGDFQPDPSARQRQIDGLAQWGLMMGQAERVVAAVGGVRLTAIAEGMHAEVLASVLNASNRALQGRWTLPQPPPDWKVAREVALNLEPGTRRSAQIDLDLGGLAFNVDGVYPFELAFESAALGTFRVPARLAVAACPPTESSPVIDGRLDDWPLASNNAAGDFRLCHARTVGVTAESDIPTLPTQAFFTHDRVNLYVAVRCGLTPGEAPRAEADNTITVDGAIPWGQDVIEVLLDPRGTTGGTSADLYCLQIKPTGLLMSRKGCRTDPPMGLSRDWLSGARIAVSVQRDAWAVELAVPRASFGAEAQRQHLWGLNVTRLDARRGEYSSWSGARGQCYLPQSLGNLIMLWPEQSAASTRR